VTDWPAGPIPGGPALLPVRVVLSQIERVQAALAEAQADGGGDT
jgi:hypothetical protein